MSFGGSLDSHREAPPSYIPDGDPGRQGGGTYTGHSVEPTLEAYENIFGPSARDIKQDLQRFKRHGRWHLPDILKGPNQYLTDRVDGLITDAANSPFTSRILPYKYITNVDGKIKWNVWSFDEGLASRVPYESAARTLTQTKRSYAGYFIRQGMAIVLEHNFMMTEAGRENFKRQLNQLVGSIQLTNDLDVHVALVLAPSYQKTMNERYLTQDKSPEQICREFVELFGFVQKNQNALDILIEEAKGQLKTWGAPMPDFMLCNSKLTFQLTMTPDVTNYVTQGPEGQKRLRTGPTLSSYRGIGIVHTRAFSMETGAPPRDMLRRRVRVAEFYRILPHKDNHKRLFQLYHEGRDTWATFTFQDLLQKAMCSGDGTGMGPGLGGLNNQQIEHCVQMLSTALTKKAARTAPVRLGQVMQADGMSDPKAIKVTQVLQMVLEKTLNNCSWDPVFIDEEMVFVPGAMDVFNLDDLMCSDKEDYLSTLPNYVRNVMTKYFERNQSTTSDTLNFAKLAVNSISNYHRNHSVVDAVSNFWRDSEEIKKNIQGRSVNFDAKNLVPSNSVANDDEEQHSEIAQSDTIVNTFLSRLYARNYLRFGVPESLIKQNADPRQLNDLLDVNIEFDQVNWVDQKLRDLGAWFCPNHFKQPQPPAFNSLGDFLGYHMLVSSELIAACHARKNYEQGRQIRVHEQTFLFDVINHFDKHKELIGTIQEQLNGWITEEGFLGSTLTRSEMYSKYGAQLRQSIENYSNEYRSRQHFEDQKFVFWPFPRTTRTQDDVYVSTAKEQWKKELQGMKEFITDLDITENVINAINDNGRFDTSVAHNSVKATVKVPSAFRSVSQQDAKNLLNMLAWRLWADQERPLATGYNVHQSVWRAPHDFLFPAQKPTPDAFKFRGPSGGGGSGVDLKDLEASEATADVEVVIVRPNIEHYMMGIILGQGGESLGSTFWGQTELSCYDDSMHGIWGMSYKYHERAIVINERNLIRLWDIAYDGYVGGKDDSAVSWNDDDPEHPHSRAAFIQATTDVTRPYRGPSMMVMAFHHGESKVRGLEAGRTFQDEFNSNWPSPIVFYDRLERGQSVAARADFDNLHAVDVQQFRVFNSELYRNAYAPYKDKMPDFWELHTIRKNAGLAATENEVSSDALAFQGTMRVLSAETGGVIQEVLGSGHHGPDFIGVASLRAGKGYRLNSQPTVHRLV